MAQIRWTVKADRLFDKYVHYPWNTRDRYHRLTDVRCEREEGDMKSAHGIRVHLCLAEGPAYFTFQTLRTMPWNCWENSGAQTNRALFSQPYLLSAGASN